MTLTEFKAWLDGFCENLPAGGAPTAEQFTKIRAKLATVTGDTVRFDPPPMTPVPWYDPSRPFLIGDRTGEPLPHNWPVTTCGIDWSSEHLADIRDQGRAEAVN